jgi:hypothetical protein
MSDTSTASAAPTAPAAITSTGPTAANAGVGGKADAGKAPETKAADSKATEAKATEEAKTFPTITVDGKEVPLTPEMVREFQKQAAADKRLQEAATAKKSVEAEKAKIDGMVAALKKGDHKALLSAGLSEDDIEQLSIGFLSGKVQAQVEAERLKGLDPREREFEELKRWKAEQEAKQKEAEEQTKQTAQQEQQAKVQEYLGSYKNDVAKTIAALPEEYRDNLLVQRIVQDGWAHVYTNADELMAQGKLRAEDVDPVAIAKDVVAHVRDLYRATLSKAKDTELSELLPPEIKDKFLTTEKAKAGKEAHPSLTGAPQVRTAKKEPVRERSKTQAELLRGIILGK